MERALCEPACGYSGPSLTKVLHSDCLGTYDPTNPLFTDISVGNDYRSWTWIVYALTPLP